MSTSSKIRRRLITLVPVCALLALGGCREIKGAAADFSWALRTFDGQSVQSCAAARISEIRLCWNAENESSGCRPGQFHSFPCAENGGVTLFEIPEGRTSFIAEPVCESGDPPVPDSFQVPSPIVRSALDGEVITLNSLLIIVTVPESLSGCTDDPAEASEELPLCTCPEA